MRDGSTRIRGRLQAVIAGAAVLLGLGPAIASAQEAPPTMTNPPTLLKEAQAAPKPGESVFSATAGLQLQGGRTGTRGWTLSGLAAHSTEKRALAQLQIDTSYGSYRAAPGSAYTTVEDNQSALFMYLRPVGPRFSWLASAGWRRDTILQLSHRWWGEGGAGVTLLDHKKAYLLVGASLAGGQERRTYLGTDPVEDIGVLQILKWTPIPTLSVEEWVRSKHDITDRSDYSTSFYASIAAKVTSHAGLKIYYSLDDEGIHPPTVQGRQTELGAGVQISFTRGPVTR